MLEQTALYDIRLPWPQRPSASKALPLELVTSLTRVGARAGNVETAFGGRGRGSCRCPTGAPCDDLRAFGGAGGPTGQQVGRGPSVIAISEGRVPEQRDTAAGRPHQSPEKHS